MDADHNRSVITIAGEPEAVKEAAFRGIAKAAELIDLNQHTGEHPRMGAADVVPFVPIEGVTMDDCVQLAKELGKRVAEELRIPVYLYDRAAQRPGRENLANIRKGEFEGIREEIGVNPEREPDFGPREVHPTAGCVAIGARMILVAFNVNLATTDVKIAKKIARAVRGATGGFQFVRALGFEIKEKGCVQVSMNLVNYKKSPMHRVFEAIRREARRYGVNVIESEIIGLVPNDALVRAARYYLQLFPEFTPDQIIENRLRSVERAPENSLVPFLDTVASDSPAPGGGSVAAANAATGAALVAMHAAITLKARKKFAEARERMLEIRSRAESLRAELTELIQKDAEAFDAIMAAVKSGRPEEEKKKVIEEATKNAVEVPLSVMERSLQVLELADEVTEHGNPRSISDGSVGALNAWAAMQGAYYNVLINCMDLDDESWVRERLRKCRDLLERGRGLMQRVDTRLQDFTSR